MQSDLVAIGIIDVIITNLMEDNIWSAKNQLRAQVFE